MRLMNLFQKKTQNFFGWTYFIVILLITSCNQSENTAICSSKKAHLLTIDHFAFPLPECYDLYELDPNKYVPDRYVQTTIAKGDTIKLEVGYNDELQQLEGFYLTPNRFDMLTTDTIQGHYLRKTSYWKKSCGLDDGYGVRFYITDMIPVKNAPQYEGNDERSVDLNCFCHRGIFSAWTRDDVCLTKAERDLFIAYFKKGKIIAEK